MRSEGQVGEGIQVEMSLRAVRYTVCVLYCRLVRDLRGKWEKVFKLKCLSARCEIYSMCPLL